MTNNSMNSMSQALGMILDWEQNAAIQADFREEMFNGHVFVGTISVIPHFQDWAVNATTRGTRTTYTPSAGFTNTHDDGRSEHLEMSTMPTRMELRPCFPLSIGMWGRRLDEWGIEDAIEEEDGFLLKLQPKRPGLEAYDSSVFVQRSVRMITAMTLGPYKLNLSSVRHQGPRS